MAALISRSPKEVRTYLHVQVREDTARLSHMRQLLYDYLRAGKAWKAPRTEETAETTSPNSVPMDVDALHREGGKGKKGKGKGKSKGDRNKHDGKSKGKQSVKQRHFDGYCNQCGEYGHKKPDCAGKSKFFNGTCNKCGAHGHKKADCPAKTVAHLESTPVNEPSEEPVRMESLEWPFALETHDGSVEVASLTKVSNRVRLLLDSGSGVSACSPHVQTHPLNGPQHVFPQVCGDVAHPLLWLEHRHCTTVVKVRESVRALHVPWLTVSPEPPFLWESPQVPSSTHPTLRIQDPPPHRLHSGKSVQVSPEGCAVWRTRVHKPRTRHRASVPQGFSFQSSCPRCRSCAHPEQSCDVSAPPYLP